MTTHQVLQIMRVREMARSGRAKEIRLAAGLSLAEVADAADTTAATVHRWENGDRVPRGEPALAYLRLLRRVESRLKVTS